MINPKSIYKRVEIGNTFFGEDTPQKEVNVEYLQAMINELVNIVNDLSQRIVALENITDSDLPPSRIKAVLKSHDARITALE